MVLTSPLPMETSPVMRLHVIFKYIRMVALTACMALSTNQSTAATPGNLAEVAVKAGNFKSLVKALEASELVDALTRDTSYTVFAPTDDAFGKLPESLLASLFQPENKEMLKTILLYHVVPGTLGSKEVSSVRKLSTLAGEAIQIRSSEGGVKIDQATVVQANVQASNGVIHVMDEVLLPASIKEQLAIKTPVMALLERAIELGVPHFNHGNHQACADIYETASMGLLNMDKGAMSDAQRKMLSRVMQTASQMHDSSGRAWTFRKAFDHLMEQQSMALK